MTGERVVWARVAALALLGLLYSGQEFVSSNSSEDIGHRQFSRAACAWVDRGERPAGIVDAAIRFVLAAGKADRPQRCAGGQSRVEMDYVCGHSTKRVAESSLVRPFEYIFVSDPSVRIEWEVCALGQYDSFFQCITLNTTSNGRG